MRTINHPGGDRNPLQFEITDAYAYCGSLGHTHPAVVVGLTGSTTDDEIDHLTARILLAFGAPPFDIMTLGPALITWRDDMRATDD